MAIWYWSFTLLKQHRAGIWTEYKMERRGPTQDIHFLLPQESGPGAQSPLDINFTTAKDFVFSSVWMFFLPKCQGQKRPPQNSKLWLFFLSCDIICRLWLKRFFMDMSRALLLLLSLVAKRHWYLVFPQWQSMSAKGKGYFIQKEVF